MKFVTLRKCFENLRFLTVIALVILYVPALAQWGSAVERSAQKDMAKHRWERAETRLRKSLLKDTLNPSVRYCLSFFYFNPDNPARHLDSAHHYAVTALGDYAVLDVRRRDRLHRLGVDSLRLATHRARIDSAAFEEARRIHTEAAYQAFISHFPLAEQRDRARRLRDEVAYRDAVQQNTYTAFLRYIERYPQSEWADEATVQYHRLLFEAMTADQQLSSYIRFVDQHPESPWSIAAYREIFDRSTADGTPHKFLAFMRQYPGNPLSRKAAAIAFHLFAEQPEDAWPEVLLNDSLRHVIERNSSYLVPILSNGHYGFIDANGRELLPPAYEQIDPEYLCGGIYSDVLYVDERLIARDDYTIYDGVVRSWEDLGLGFLIVHSDKDARIVHKSGFVVADSIDDARVVGGRFLAVLRGGDWTLHSLTGRQLDKRRWDDIGVVQNLIVFRRGHQRFLAPKDALMVSGEELAVAVSEPFNALRPWSGGLLWGRSGDFEGVVDVDMNTVIRFDRHRLIETFFGAAAESGRQFVLYTRDGRRSSTLDAYAVAGKQVAGKHNGVWRVLDGETLEPFGALYDSVRAEGAFLIGYGNDSMIVHFLKHNTVSFRRTIDLAFVPGRDSTSFLKVRVRGYEHALYDLYGNRLFAASFDAIEYAGGGVFIMTRRGKKGLIDMGGRALLPAEFDAIGSLRGNVISVLRDRKFGAYRVSDGKYIRPQYDRNVKHYASNWAVGYKQGAYGFVDWDGRPAGGFTFEEVRYWSDSVALVRHEGKWAFYDIGARTHKAQGLRSVTMFPHSAMAIVQKDRSFGVVDNQGQELIPATFSDIVNLGTGEVPLFFTEKHIRDTSVFVVVYYDNRGNMLRTEVYDDAADYDKIYCAVN